MSHEVRRGGRYVVESEIGSGGVAVVHRARDEKTGEVVALKELLPQFASDRALRRRFLREAEVMRTLDHPGIVRLLDAGQDADTAWLALELVEGEDLRRRLDRAGPPAADEARRIVIAVAHALGHAHQRGVVHRDLKPQNVLLGGEGLPTVKLSDFGSARVQTLASLTGSSLVWGSPQYMAPEVFARGRVDPRSDLFSLGVVMCELATGKLPWGDTAPLARLAAGAGVVDLPSLGWGADVDALAAAMLSPEPSARPASAAEVIAVLEGGARPAELVRTTACANCGASRAEDIPVCLACGREELRVRHRPGGTARLVLQKIGDDAVQTERIHRLMEGLTGERDLRLEFLTRHKALYSKREQKEGIGLPAVLFDELGMDDARRLKVAFEAGGFKVETQEIGFSWANAPRPVSFALVITATVGMLGAVLSPVLLLLTGGSIVAWGVMRSGVLRARKKPGRFRLREQGAAVPISDRLLGEAQKAATDLREPEARALFNELATATYRLAQRAEAWAAQDAGAGSEAALAHRLLDAAPAISAQLARAARRLDDLGAALDRDSEGDAAQAWARIDRRLGSAPAAERAQLEAARDEVMAALERRHAVEEERARLSSVLCAVLANLRDAYRRAADLTAPAEREAVAIESAAADLERYLR